jgi:hypothetical protein
VGDVERMGKIVNIFRILVENFQGRRLCLLERLNHVWENDIKRDIEEKVAKFCNLLTSIDLVQVQCRGCENGTQPSSSICLEGISSSE